MTAVDLRGLTRILVALVALLAPVACRGLDESPVITISASAVGGEGAILERQLRRFEAANPGLRVAIQRTPDDATQRHQLYVQWLNARLGSPDVLQLDVVWTAELAAAGWIEPLELADADDFFPAVLDACRWNGRLWAVPWFVDVGMLYWRTDLLDAAPASLAELAEAGATTGTRLGFVWQGARYEGLVTVFLEILGAHGGRILDERGRPALDEPAAVAALAYLRTLIARGISPAEVLTWHEEETRFAFQNGDAAMMRNWPYAATLLDDRETSRVAGKFGVAPVPAAPGGRPSAALGGAPLAVNAWSPRKEEARRLVAFLTAPEQMVERAAATGQFPPRRSLYGTPALDEALATDSSTVRTIVEAAIPRPVTPVYSELSEILQIEIHRALAGVVAPRDALRRADARIAALLARTGLAPGDER